MTPISCRIWDKIDNKWVEGYTTVIYFDRKLVTTDNRFIMTIGTGKVDVNGNEIFVGDLIEVGTVIAEVVFVDGCFGIIWNGNNYSLSGRTKDSIKIIGNTFEDLK